MNVQMQRRSRVSFKGCRVSVKCSRVSLKAGGFGTDPASQQLLTRNASDNTEDDEISQVGENGPWSSDSEEDEQPSVRRFAGSAPPSSLGTGLFFGLPVRVCPGAQGVTAKATAQVSTPDYYPDREEGLWPENLMARFSQGEGERSPISPLIHAQSAEQLQQLGFERVKSNEEGPSCISDNKSNEAPNANEAV